MSDQLEPRFLADLVARVFGMDAEGRPFSRKAHILDISDRGARLSGLDAKLLVGDVIGVQLGDRKARCRVIWFTGPAPPIEVGVEIVAGQPCPWDRERAAHRSTATPPILRSAPVAKDKRKFRRHRISFPIEIRDGRSVGCGECGDDSGHERRRVLCGNPDAASGQRAGDHLFLVEFRTSANHSRGQDQ